MPWYRERDYDRLRGAVFEDGGRLHETWQELKAVAEVQFEARGLKVYHPIEPDAFTAWCTQRAMRRDARARTASANEAAKRLHAAAASA